MIVTAGSNAIAHAFLRFRHLFLKSSCDVISPKFRLVFGFFTASP